MKHADATDGIPTPPIFEEMGDINGALKNVLLLQAQYARKAEGITRQMRDVACESLAHEIQRYIAARISTASETRANDKEASLALCGDEIIVYFPAPEGQPSVGHKVREEDAEPILYWKKRLLELEATPSATRRVNPELDPRITTEIVGVIPVVQPNDKNERQEKHRLACLREQADLYCKGEDFPRVMMEDLCEKFLVLADEQLTSTPSATPMLKDEQVEWVVNDIAELGVKIGNQFFWLYKGHSLVYGSHDDSEQKDGICLHDDGKPMHWRPVGKREFGECCHPVNYEDLRSCGKPHYIGKVSLDDSDEWKPLPVQPRYVGGGR